jgi:menaquinone-dependent protoporphyrinogen IX oxidase
MHGGAWYRVEMSDAKILVVYYSRTGTTRSLAAGLAKALGADLEEICDCSNREGLDGYLRSLVDAFHKRQVEIVPAGLDVSAYDLVVIGSPVWAGSVSAPGALIPHGESSAAAAGGVLLQLRRARR